MSRIKEPSIEELQLRIDELEKSHNTYSEVIDTFTNGYVMDLISSNIKTIGKMCFAGCSLLGDISCYATTAPTLGENVFGDSISSYAGKNASTKIFRYPVNSLGYDSDS